MQARIFARPLLVLAAALSLLGACVGAPNPGQATPTVGTPAPLATPVPTLVVAVTPLPTLTPSPRPSDTPTRLPSPSATPTFLPSATPSPLPTRTATATPPPSPTPRPTTAPSPSATSLPTATAAPTRPGSAPLVAVDPGHGGTEIGAVYQGGGLVLREKDVNLAIARRLAGLLNAAGYRVLLTRDADTSANLPPADRNDDGAIDLQDDLQARIDRANEAGADLLLSLHNNGSESATQSGSEVYYCQHRPHAEKNLFLAQALQRAFVRRLGEVGYATADRGARGDTNFRILNGVPQHVSLLGPAQPPRILRPSQMPAVLGESLFLSHPEGALLVREDVQQAIAQAYFDTVEAYFGRFGE